MAESALAIQAAQPRIGADWAGLGALQLLLTPPGYLVAEALACIPSAAQPNRWPSACVAEIVCRYRSLMSHWLGLPVRREGVSVFAR